MRTIELSDVCTHCHRLLAELEASGRAMTVTKNGVAVAWVVPIAASRRLAPDTNATPSPELEKRRQELADAFGSLPADYVPPDES